MTAPTTTPASRDDALVTRFPFELPHGFVDDDGTVHRTGTMRLATARDEILPLRDPRVRDNEAYLTVLLLARTVTRLGSLTDLSPSVIEAGQLVVEVGIAPVKPAEFVVFRLAQMPSGVAAIAE